METTDRPFRDSDTLGKIVAGTHLMSVLHEDEMRHETDFSAKTAQSWAENLSHMRAAFTPLLRYTHRIQQESGVPLPGMVNDVIQSLPRELEKLQPAKNNRDGRELIQHHYGLLSQMRQIRARLEIVIVDIGKNLRDLPEISLDDMQDIGSIKKVLEEKYNEMESTGNKMDPVGFDPASRDATLALYRAANVLPKHIVDPFARGIHSEHTHFFNKLRSPNVTQEQWDEKQHVARRHANLHVVHPNGFENTAAEAAENVLRKASTSSQPADVAARS